MAVLVGNSWVSEQSYAKAKAKIESEKNTNADSKVSNSDYLQTLRNEYKGTNFTTSMQPFKGKGMHNIAISPNILRQMDNDPEKRLEYESIILDCIDGCKMMERDGRRKSFGFILDANGNLSSWSISKTDKEKSETKALNMLPKDNKDAWLSIILESLPKNESTAAKTDRVEISEEARKFSLGLKEYGSDSPLKYDDAFFSQEAREKRKTELGRPVEIDPFDNEFQILGVTYTFNDGTLEKLISDSLDGKVKNASLVAAELGQMIRGTIYNPDATVEERAINRETALKHAAYIAENYLDNPDEAKAFLDGINRFAENDVLREKGYIVLDNSDMAPFKSYQSPATPGGGISWDAYAKQYGLSSARDIFTNKETLNSFYNALRDNNKTWSKDISKGFEDNENKVADIISMIKGTLNEVDVETSLKRFLKAL